MTQQILLDLPLLAVTLAAYACWARNRRIAYFLLAGYATLIKAHGFLLISGPFLAAILSHGAFYKRQNRKTFLVDIGSSSASCA